MKLSDIKIGTKILAIILAFGLSAIGMTVWQNANIMEAEKGASFVTRARCL